MINLQIRDNSERLLLRWQPNVKLKGVENFWLIGYYILYDFGFRILYIVVWLASGRKVRRCYTSSVIR